MSETVRITRLAAGGDGVGRLADGRVVFVPRTAAGDLAALTRVRRKANFARAEVERIVEPSPERTTPPCAHYDGDLCGGCALQHLTYAGQVAAKGAFVRDALERIAKAEVPPFDVVPSARPLGYRTRLGLTADVRTGAIGLHRLERPDEVFDLVRCEIAAPALQTLWTALAPQRALLPPSVERLTLREDRGGGLHVILHGVPDWPRAAEVDAALGRAAARATLWTAGDGVARVVGGREPTQSAGVFEQVDPVMGDLVRSDALSRVGDVAGVVAWDLYAGIGETSAALAARGAIVESVESDAEAVAESARRGPSSVRRLTGRVEERIGRLSPPRVVVANPPRAGLGPEVVDGLLAAAPERIVYVSCDPATLARDIARLGVRYRLAALRAFDSFPQTAHVETVTVLAPRAPGQGSVVKNVGGSGQLNN